MKIREVLEHYNDYLDQKMVLEGWIKTSRDSKNFGFIQLTDGSGFDGIQVVYEGDIENFKEISKYPLYSSIRVEGNLVESPGAKQPIEIHATKIEPLHLAESDYPLQKKRHTFEYLRTKAHLRPRTNTFQAVFRVRSLIAFAIHEFFQQRNFVYVHTPIITASDAEGAGEMFQVTTFDLNNVPKKDGVVDFEEDFFGKHANLTVSGQLQAEAYALAFRDVYTFGPTFRAENSNTQRHAAEFWMIEPEMAFADLNVNMDVAEAMLKYIINYVFEHAPKELEFFNSFIDKGLIDRLKNVVESDFVRITYTEAIDILEKCDREFKYPVSW